MKVEIIEQNKNTVISNASGNITNNAKASNKRKVAGYARVSTEKDEQFNSYEAQIEYYTRLINSHEDWEFVNIYTDEGITGTNTKKRIGFRTMIKDALEGKIDLIVTKSVSRFARNTVDSLTTIRELKNNNTEIFFEKENIWTFDEKGELLITIMSSIAQEESRSISKNVTWGMREKMRQGQAWVPYKVFLGYDRGPDGNMVINPKQAIIVRRIYGMFLQGLSPYAIGKKLESEGIEFSIGKNNWYATTINSILRNEKYIGDALRQKTYSKDYLTKTRVKNNGELKQYYISDHHEAIISKETFEKVQLELNNREKKTIYCSGKRLFSRRIKCADCGGWFSPVVWFPHSDKEQLLWRCTHKYYRTKTQCSTPFVNENEIKNVIVDAINLYTSNKENASSIISALRKELFITEGFEIERKELEQEIKKVSELINLQDKEYVEILQERKYLAEQRIKQIDDEITSIKAKESSLINSIIDVFDHRINISECDDYWFYFVRYVTVYNHTKFKVVFKDGKTCDVFFCD